MKNERVSRIMRKQSMRRKIVNLSTLVDVFMIVIFWYLMFSNQNLNAQETAAQGKMDKMQGEYETKIDVLEEKLENTIALKNDSDAYIRELLEQIEKLEKRLSDMQEELDGLKEAMTVLEQENAELKAANEELKGENDKLMSMMNQEGEVLLFRLLNATDSLQILECTYKEEVFRHTFTDKERDKLAEFVAGKIDNALENGKLNVVFTYEGAAVYSKDVETINKTIKERQSEIYFIYNEFNLSRYN